MKLIDADKLYSKVKTEANPYGKPTLEFQSGCLVLDIIDKQPTIEAAPVVRGEWMGVTHGRGGHECSKCRGYAPSFQNGVEYLSNYCPNCGSYNGGDKA